MFDFRRSPSSAARYRSRLGRHTCWGDFRLDCDFERRDVATVETSVGWTKWTFCRVSPLRRRTCALSSSKLVFVMHMIQVGNCLPQSKGGNEVAEAAAGPRVGRLFLAARLVWDHLPPCFGWGSGPQGLTMPWWVGGMVWRRCMVTFGARGWHSVMGAQGVGHLFTHLTIQKHDLTIKTKRDAPSYWLKSAPLPTMSFAPRADLRATGLAALSPPSRALVVTKYCPARRKQPWPARLRLSTTSCWPVRSEVQRSSNRCRSRTTRLSTARPWRP